MSRIRFNQFEFDLSTNELWRDSNLVPMQPKQAKVLAILLKNPQSLINREEIKALVWGNTVVEFDQSINFCIKGIRQTLGDNPKQPTFIQTIPKKGYRFIAEIQEVIKKNQPLNEEEESSAGQPIRLGKTKKLKRAIRYLLASGSGLVFAITSALWWTSEVQPQFDNTPLQKFQQNLDHDFKRAVYLFEKGGQENYAKSSAIFAKILAIKPDHPDASAYYGISSFFSGNDIDANLLREHSELANMYHPNQPMTLIAKGMTSLYLDWDIADAHENFSLAVSSSPTLTIGWHELAVTSVILNKLELARKSIEKALLLEPGAVQERYHSGWFYMATGDFKSALTQCQQTIELSNTHAFSFKCAAESALEVGLSEQAKRYFLSFMKLYKAKENDLVTIEQALNEQHYSQFYKWLYQEWRERGAPAFYLASANASAGDYTLARQYLVKALEKHEPFLFLILAQQEFIPMSNTPEYQRVVQAIKL